MAAWCECEHPDVRGDRDFGMCQRCKRKPHTACKASKWHPLSEVTTAAREATDALNAEAS